MFAQQNNLQLFTVDDGLPSNIIFDIHQDKTGYLWIATEKGLVKFDGDDFTQINKQKTTNLTTKNNTIYAGLENGLLIKEHSKEVFLASKKVLKTFIFNDIIFVGTEEGVYKIYKNHIETIKINTEINKSSINDIIFVYNAFYVATNKGLWKLNRLENPSKIEKINNNYIISLANFQNEIIVATLKNGIKTINANAIEKTISFQENITSVKKLKNEIWVTSNKNGIEIFTLPSFSFKQKINKYNSLKTDEINTVFKDNQNTIWIATNKGLYQLKNDNYNNSNNKKPVIYFENLLVNNRKVDSLLNSKIAINFSPSENNISIYFKTVDLINPKKIKYRYQLIDGFSAWSTNNSVQFANLNAGRYTFKIQSKIDKEESKIKSFSFKIDAPFYKKTTYILAAIALLLFIAYLILDFYIRNLNKKNKEKIDTLKLENHLLSLEQKALQLQMNPHFIFNVLNGIKALGNSGKTTELNTTISQFSVLLRSILNNSRKEEISLKEEIESLKNYIELEQKMSSKTFEYKIITNLNNIDAEEILIPTMLVQPFIENAIKHGFQANTKGIITISFDVKYHFLNCSIIDNGIGIDQSKKGKSNSNHNSLALKVSKERITHISNKSSFTINEIVENSMIKGTKVWFKIPLKTDF
ncbi:sensor histidine kinase [Polaribacter sp. KT25b]|uniref:sensor histidine kinase n=1 Tax=Polaribacter sp. KT25b TaxID=1855336 RepID=UPI00155FB4AC|nr:sensor histidine kinase [Polaribacter sp. KT25b]